MCESDVWEVRANSEAAIQQQLLYAAHLGLPAIMVSLTTPRCVNLARLINNRVARGVCYQVFII